MAAVRPITPGGPGSGPLVRGTGVDQWYPGAIGAFGSTLSLVNQRHGRQKGGHPNECPHAGVRVAGD
jgi:hypothetical protein